MLVSFSGVGYYRTVSKLKKKRKRKCTESVMQVQSCCFVYLKDIFLFSLPSASALLSENKTTTTMTPTVSLDLVLFRPKTSETRVRVQALWGALAAGQQKEGELATTSLGFDFTSNSRLAPRRLSCQISSNQRKAETSTNVNKY